VKITRAKIIAAVLLTPLIAVFLLLFCHLFGVARWLQIRILPTNWALQHAVCIERPGDDWLLLMVEHAWRDLELDTSRLLLISAADGRVLGERVEDLDFNLFGLTAERVWARPGHRGYDDFAGYALPGLQRTIDGRALLAAHPELERIVKRIRPDGPAALRIFARDGYQYRLQLDDQRLQRLALEPAPPAPDLLQRLPDCRWRIPGPVKDARDCKPLRLPGGGDRPPGRLMAASETRGGLRQLVLYAAAPDGSSRWRLTEQQLFGPRDPDEPPRRIFSATRADGRLLLVAADRRPEDLYLAAVDPAAGSILWQRRFR
jgi:hypothetical protein